MFESLSRHIAGNPWPPKVAVSVVIVAAALLLRWLLRRSIRVMEIPSNDLRRRWILSIRAMTVGIVVLGLGIVWAAQLQTVAISVVAILVALVLSFKELIACITGSFLKIGGRAFVLGDRIRVGELRGDVIDQTLLTTTLMEVGPGASSSQYTGRTLVVPNSLYLTEPVIRDSPIGGFALIILVVPVKVQEDIEALRAVLLEACRDAVAGYMAEVRAAARRIERAEGIELPSVDPRVTRVLVDPDRCDLVVRLPAPVAGQREIEQRLIAVALAWRRARAGAVDPSVCA